MSTTIVPGDRPGLALSAELRAVDTEYPGWHCWLSDSARVNATHSLSAAEMAETEGRYRVGTRGLRAGSGVTLDAATPALIRTAIAQYVALAARAA